MGTGSARPETVWLLPSPTPKTLWDWAVKNYSELCESTRELLWREARISGPSTTTLPASATWYEPVISSLTNQELRAFVSWLADNTLPGNYTRICFADDINTSIEDDLDRLRRVILHQVKIGSYNCLLGPSDYLDKYYSIVRRYSGLEPTREDTLQEEEHRFRSDVIKTVQSLLHSLRLVYSNVSILLGAVEPTRRLDRRELFKDIEYFCSAIKRIASRTDGYEDNQWIRAHCRDFVEVWCDDRFIKLLRIIKDVRNASAHSDTYDVYNPFALCNALIEPVSELRRLSDGFPLRGVTIKSVEYDRSLGLTINCLAISENDGAPRRIRCQYGFIDSVQQFVLGGGKAGDLRGMLLEDDEGRSAMVIPGNLENTFPLLLLVSPPSRSARLVAIGPRDDSHEGKGEVILLQDVQETGGGGQEERVSA